MLAVGVELGRVGVPPAQHVARQLYGQYMQAQAQAQVGYIVLAGVARGGDLAVYAAVAKAAGHQHRVRAAQQRLGGLVGHFLGLYPVYVHIHAVFVSGMAQRLGHRKVGVVQRHVLAHQRHLYVAGAAVYALQHAVPVAHVGGGRVHVQLAQHYIGKVVLLQHHRGLIEHRHGQVLYHAIGLHVAEQGYLVEHALLYWLVRASDDYVGHYAEGLQLLYRMLGGLGLVLARGLDVGHQRHVYVQAVVLAHLMTYLAYRLQEGLALHVAGGAAYLGEHHVGVGLFAHGVDEALYLAGYVGYHLHGLAQVVAAPLGVQHVPVHLAGGEVGVLVEVLVYEALVVAQVEVGLGAVLGHVYLAVLVGAHGAGIHVYVRIQLLRADLEPALLEQAPQRRHGYALAQTGNHASGHEYVLGHSMRLLLSISQSGPSPACHTE